MLIGRIKWCVHAEVHANAVAHQLLTVQRLSYCDGGFDVKERDNDPTKRLEWRPCVYFGMLIDSFADLGQSVELKNFRGKEVLSGS